MLASYFSNCFTTVNDGYIQTFHFLNMLLVLALGALPALAANLFEADYTNQRQCQAMLLMTHTRRRTHTYTPLNGSLSGTNWVGRTRRNIHSLTPILII